MKNIFHIVLTTLLFVGFGTFATAQSHVTPTPVDMYSHASHGLEDATIHGQHHINSIKSKNKELPKFMLKSLRDNMTDSKQKSNSKQNYIVSKKSEV